MKEADRLKQENQALLGRLSKLSEASLRITESLDLGATLQEVADSARSLTAARYGALVTFDGSGLVRDVITSGISPEERRRLREMPQGQRLFAYLNDLQEPLRFKDLAGHTQSAGFPEDHPPVKTFLTAPVHHRGERVGSLYLGRKEGGRAFTREDEGALVMFAAQAALVIANARRHEVVQRARADLEAVVRAAPVGFVIVDAETRRIVSINREMERIFSVPPQFDIASGVPLDESRERAPLRSLDGRAFLPGQHPVERALGGETVRAEEVVFHVSEDRTVTALISATPIYSEDGRLSSAVVVIQDMTPLEELERLRTDFLGMVSHELRGPLTAIKGAAATAMGGASPPGPAETRHLFRIIDGQADVLRDLINNLLDVTRIAAGALSVATEPADLAEMIDEARRAFLRGGAGNAVEVDLAPGLPRIAADRQRVGQVLRNLLSNASKYSPEQSTIRVSAALEDVYIVISVADEGKGVAAKDLPGLFRKFSRSTEDGEPKTAGEGLGLAICKGVVEAHGGRIWAESAGPERGARFTFTIPTVDEAPPAAAGGPAQQPAFPGPSADGPERVRILAVDDDPQALRSVGNALSDAGFAPTVTGDPDAVVRLVEAERPRLLLLDLMLPGTDGFALMQRIAEVSDAPVIFPSAYGGDENVARALELGADDYLVKPFSPAELTARIKAALRRRAAATDRPEDRTPYRLGALTIDYAQRAVTVAGQPVRLTATEYTLLLELSFNAGRVLTYDHLLRRVWGPEYAGDAHLVRAFVKNLRRKLGDDAGAPVYIFTERRVGYRFAKSA